jgi:hypothetical protein
MLESELIAQGYRAGSRGLTAPCSQLREAETPSVARIQIAQFNKAVRNPISSRELLFYLYSVISTIILHRLHDLVAART